MTMEIESTNSAKYTLRTKSLLKRLASERSRDEVKRKEPKTKQKPPPLSKYRRKTANARERGRMQEINEAFETLQKTLPDLPGIDAEKLTKITVLRLAVNYIKILAHVTDENLMEEKDITELRQLWCSKNAHMAKPEHCVRPVFRSSKIIQSKPQKSSNLIQKSPKAMKVSKTTPSSEMQSLNTVIHPKKRSNKSRVRGKICKTASVATSNGAYITLKNLAFQITPSRTSHIDNKPIMMSMTLKRPRLEQISFTKACKIAKYEPPRPQKRPIRPSAAFNKTIPPLFGHPRLDASKELSCFTIYDLPKSNLVKNLRVTSTYNPMDDCSSRLSNTFPYDCCSLSPIPSVSPSDSLFNASSSDSDIDFNPALELDNLLASQPFEEELDHLASSFVDNDDTLSLLLGHSLSNPFCSDSVSNQDYIYSDQFY